MGNETPRRPSRYSEGGAVGGSPIAWEWTAHPPRLDWSRRLTTHSRTHLWDVLCGPAGPGVCGPKILNRQTNGQKAKLSNKAIKKAKLSSKAMQTHMEAVKIPNARLKF